MKNSGIILCCFKSIPSTVVFACHVTKPFDLKVLKTDLSVYIESDADIIKSENKIVYLDETCKYIDGALKSIQARGWDIKNCLEAQKFEAGLQ